MSFLGTKHDCDALAEERDEKAPGMALDDFINASMDDVMQTSKNALKLRTEAQRKGAQPLEPELKDFGVF